MLPCDGRLPHLAPAGFYVIGSSATSKRMRKAKTTDDIIRPVYLEDVARD